MTGDPCCFVSFSQFLPRPEAMRKDKKTGDYTDGAIFIYERTKKAAKFLLEPLNSCYLIFIGWLY